jgi:hypothetical protein
LCFIRKIKRRSLDDVAFAEFDRNLNFIPDDILPDVVARLKKSRKLLSLSDEFSYVMEL